MNDGKQLRDDSGCGIGGGIWCWGRLDNWCNRWIRMWYRCSGRCIDWLLTSLIQVGIWKAVNMWNYVVYWVGLVLSCIIHCQSACFFKPAVGCEKMCFKIHPTFLDWIHLIPGFYYILEFYFIFDDGVGYIHSLFLGAQETSQFLVLSEVANLVKTLSIGLLAS